MQTPHRPRLAAAAFAAVFTLVVSGVLVPGLQARQQPEALPTAPAVAPGPPRPAPVLFHEAGCEQCHGANLAGTVKGPSLLTVGRVLKKEEIRRQIHDGGGEMPAFADALEPDEIDRLVEFLSTRKKAAKGLPPTPPLTAPAAPVPQPAASGSSDQ